MKTISACAILFAVVAYVNAAAVPEAEAQKPAYAPRFGDSCGIS